MRAGVRWHTRRWYWSRNEVVQQHAREVWGAEWEQKNAENRPPAKVFSFVGKSADEVRSLASNVSQEVTGAEERVQLNRIRSMRCCGDLTCSESSVIASDDARPAEIVVVLTYTHMSLFRTVITVQKTAEIEV